LTIHSIFIKNVHALAMSSKFFIERNLNKILKSALSTWKNSLND